MDALELALKYNDLLTLYGPLMTETQREILEDYFAFNLSLTEIAENRGCSRSAVEDAIKKGKAKLDKLESQIGNYSLLLEIYDKKTKTSNIETLKVLDEVERKLKHGI
jgi:predicted DNA-binding protein YlxM (UPF0122 family)